MRLPSSTLAIAFGALAAFTAIAEAAPMRLAGHRAVYDLSLAESRGAGGGRVRGVASSSSSAAMPARATRCRPGR